MKMNKNVKVGLGVAIFCIVISMFACSDKSAEISNNIDQELSEQYPDKAVDPPVTEEPEIEDEYVEPNYTEPTSGNFEEAKQVIDDLCMEALPGDGTVEYVSYYDEQTKTLGLGFKVNLFDSTQYTQTEIDNMLAEYDIVNLYADLNRQAENLLETYGVTDVTVNTCIFDMNLVPVKYIY